MRCWRELRDLRAGLQAGTAPPAQPAGAVHTPPLAYCHGLGHATKPCPEPACSQGHCCPRVALLTSLLYHQAAVLDVFSPPDRLQQPGTCSQADGKTPCKRIGIMYSVWHWPASRATDMMRANGTTPVTVEDVLRSRRETPIGTTVSTVALPSQQQRLGALLAMLLAVMIL